MVLFDTNLFVIDRFFPRDPRFAPNQRLLARLPTLDAAFSLFSLMELCGIASFNLSSHELNTWFTAFDSVYRVRILPPLGLSSAPGADSWFADFVASITGCMARRATWGDAMVLLAAEQYHAEAIITWNKKHFEGRTEIPVFTPEGYEDA